MSDVVNTGTGEFFRGRQNHVGGVVVSVCGVAARHASEDTHTQREPLLDSRTTIRAGHRRIGGRNQHHLPPHPRGTLDQFTFRSPDRGIRCFAGHGGTGEEFRCEVLDSDHLVGGDHAASPHPRRVGVLPRCFLVQTGGFAPRPQVTLARGVPAWPPTASHCALRPSQSGSATTAIPRVRQVMVGAGGRRGHRHSPADPDTTGRGGRGFEGRRTTNEAYPEISTSRYRRAYRAGHSGSMRRTRRPHHRTGNHARPCASTRLL